jgi:hypothetical protein
VDDTSYDVIVVGAGLAGLCCAGELVAQGARPLLISESQEVGYLYRSDWIGENRCLMQMATRHVAWGGGWWYGLVRRLNLPIKLYPSFTGMQATIRGTGEMHHLSMCVSPANLVELIGQVLPIPMDTIRPELERVLGAAMALPYQELFKLHRVSVPEWFEEQGVKDELVKMIPLVLGAALSGLTVQDAQHLSVPGLFGLLRSYCCGEGDSWVVYPDVREGLCMPIAKEIEQRGGTVWRGRRISQVQIDGDKAGTVVMEDGTEVSAPAVAMAYSNGRTAALLGQPLPEVEASLAFEAQFDGLQAFEIFSLLDRNVDQSSKSWQMVIDADASPKMLSWSVQDVAPWAVEPGKFLLASECVLSATQVENAGGPAAVYANLGDLTEELHPGYKDAVLATVNQTHPSWLTHICDGPKLPRISPSVDGLYFVGDTSEPFCGLAMEASASAGILGARAILSRAVVMP